MSKYVIPHEHFVRLKDRSQIKHHDPAVLWFTGLSGSGKSTIANALENVLNKTYHVHTYLLDGDNVRNRLNKDLGFSSEDRKENIRRVGEVACLLYDAGLIVLTAFISPFRNDREKVRQLLPKGAFLEIFLDCPLEVCKDRDPKGLYKKAEEGVLKEFTGIDSPYERPSDPELILDSSQLTVKKCADEVIDLLVRRNIITRH